jgi:predicted MPP superfamily phosphohydrolase
MSFDGRNLLIFLALSVGHAALLIAVINRLHALALPRFLLKGFRALHDVLIVACPAAFLWFCGLHGPQLLYGGSWHLVPLPVLAYLVICGTIALALPIIAARRILARPPHLLVSNHSQRLDIAQQLRHRPVGRGPGRWMTYIPRNEFLELEASDKEFRHPRLPATWDGLSILHLSDLHFIGVPDRSYFEQVVKIARTMPANMVVFTGDLLDREEFIDWVPETLGRLTAPLGCHYVLGNHDSYLRNTDEVRRRLHDLGWHDLAGRCQSIPHRGGTLAVCGSETPWMGRQPDTSAIPEGAFRLFLSHTPDNLAWARRNRMDVMLSGHTHGGQVRLPGFGPIYSPSIVGTRYAGGAVWEPPTLLYVTRGIAGRQPWRWNCLPELTRLILRKA